jgi:hypothetical protein
MILVNTLSILWRIDPLLGKGLETTSTVLLRNTRINKRYEKWLGKHVPAETNTHATTEKQCLDAVLAGEF